MGTPSIGASKFPLEHLIGWGLSPAHLSDQSGVCIWDGMGLAGSLFRYQSNL